MYLYRYSLLVTALLIAGLLILSTAPCGAADVGAKATVSAQGKQPDHRFVLRLSGPLLNSLMKGNDIDRESDVREEILGTSIYGKARAVPF